MAKKKTVQEELSTEEKILASARKLFTEHGFHAVKTRDIASDAGINLALLNYYFRGKEQLFNRVMEENLSSFKLGLAQLFSDQQMDLYEKFQNIAELYHHEFIANPDLPLFIFNHMSSNKEMFQEGDHIHSSRIALFDQLSKLMKQGKIKKMHHAHVMMNLMSMIMFPYLMSKTIMRRANISEKDMQKILKERTTLIPIWMKEILKP